MNTTCTDVSVGALSSAIILNVDASLNWWGSDAGPQDHGDQCPAIDGNDVVVTPWLTSAP